MPNCKCYHILIAQSVVTNITSPRNRPFLKWSRRLCSKMLVAFPRRWSSSGSYLLTFQMWLRVQKPKMAQVLFSNATVTGCYIRVSNSALLKEDFQLSCQTSFHCRLNRDAANICLSKFLGCLQHLSLIFLYTYFFIQDIPCPLT